MPAILRPITALILLAAAGCLLPSQSGTGLGDGWTKTELPAVNGVANLGVARPFCGVSNGVLLLGGGSNFPDKQTADGGAKACHDELFVLAPGKEWQLRPEQLPHGSVAEGIPVSTPDGIACIGGTDGKADLAAAFLMSWDVAAGKAVFRDLPPLPKTLRMGAGAAKERQVYVACGKQDGKVATGFWRLDLAHPENGWISLPPLPGVPREQPVAAILENAAGHRVFCIFGGNGVEPDGRQTALTDGYSYDLTQGDHGTWKPAAAVRPKGFAAPVSLLGASAVVLNGKMLCAGGFNKAVWDDACQMQAELKGDDLAAYRKKYLSQPPAAFRWNRHLLAYDAKLDVWEDCGELPFAARCGAAMVVMPGNVLVIASGEIKPGVRTPDVRLRKF